MWGFLFTFTVFDVYRAKNISLKGNYAISDLLSREGNPINQAYLNGAESVFRYLTQGGNSTWMRVTQVYCNANCTNNETRQLHVDWSHSTDNKPVYTTQTMRTKIAHAVPLLAQGERALIVETSVDYYPPFVPTMLWTPASRSTSIDYPAGWGYIKPRTFVDIVITEPRFAPKLCWMTVC
ncbi:hypothetical protein [Maritimibacter sp. DP1N21-5]|uniref:hypothetical protein n=1 Tax=Maritimibacter sp. DP1N21-5 TaxID=2836867 RepID=UPI001C460B55|nr:hypothetical protein [Maritimibacter sp. DP1N21-5]